MTRKKAGQIPLTGDSAKAPIHEATEDGPEGYSVEGSIRQSEDDEIKVPYEILPIRQSKAKLRTIGNRTL